MRHVRSLVLTTLILLVGQSAYGAGADPLLAGDERGNGGSVVVCRDHRQQPSKVWLFDVYEQLNERGYVFRTSRIPDPVEAAVDLLADVRRFTPHRGGAYEKFIRAFMAQVQWAGDLTRIPDLETDTKAPHGCAIEQLIIRRRVIEFPEDKRFLINMNLWNAMDPQMRAAAIMHEAFYDEALAAGHRSSRLVRYFLVRMNMVTQDAMTDRQFVEATHVSRFPFWEFKRAFQRSLVTRKEIEFVDDQLEFDEKDALIRIRARKKVPLELYHPLLWDPWLPGQLDNGFYPNLVEKVEFGKDGTITAQLSDAKGGARPWAMIRDQKVWLVRGGTIEMRPDLFVRLKIDGCYVSPDSGVKQCGDVEFGPPPPLNETGVTEGRF